MKCGVPEEGCVEANDYVLVTLRFPDMFGRVEEEDIAEIKITTFPENMWSENFFPLTIDTEAKENLEAMITTFLFCRLLNLLPRN